MVRGGNLNIGCTKSCGCLRKETSGARNFHHGESNTRNKRETREYRAWHDMRVRCTNKKQPFYYRYGGRGITFCKRWQKYTNFLEDMGRCPKGMTLERINNDGNYEPGNCKWATQTEQTKNTTQNHIIEFNGEKKTIGEWGNSTGIDRSLIGYRLRKGWSIEDALTMRPTQRRDHERDTFKETID